MQKHRVFIILIPAIIFFVTTASSLYAHCEIPCGIYNDNLRIELIREDIQTIEKSMNEINELSKAGAINYNQLVRWINNKDDHASKLQEIITQYFMTQRIKPVSPADEVAYKDYINKLSLLHEMLVYAMKCKQTTDIANTQKLSQLTDQFYNAYFGAEEKEHLKEHKQ